jgi:hypothetical protein
VPVLLRGAFLFATFTINRREEYYQIKKAEAAKTFFAASAFM